MNHRLSPDGDRHAQLRHLRSGSVACSKPAILRDNNCSLLNSSRCQSEKLMSNLLRSPVAWMVAALIALAGGGIYWQIGVQQKREQAERERIAEEQAEQKRAAEIEARRKLELARLQEEMQAKKDIEEKQRQMDVEFRQAELGRKQFTVDERAGQATDAGYSAALAERVRIADEYNRRMNERKQDYESESSRRQAQSEVERQRRYVQEREAEDQAARARREQSARESQPVPPRAATPAPEPKAPYIPPPVRERAKNK